MGWRSFRSSKTSPANPIGVPVWKSGRDYRPNQSGAAAPWVLKASERSGPLSGAEDGERERSKGRKSKSRVECPILFHSTTPKVGYVPSVLRNDPSLCRRRSAPFFRRSSSRSLGGGLRLTRKPRDPVIEQPINHLSRSFRSSACSRPSPKQFTSSLSHPGMRTVLALASLLLAGVFGQDCSSPQSTRAAFGGYLQCIKDALDADYGAYETEVREHNRRAASSCFSATISEANAKDRCVLAPSDLDSKAWDRNGPLRDCSICRTFASGAIKAILSTPAADQKCIRTEISKAIAREADFCIKKKIADFPGVPDIPDLEEGSFDFKENVINSISDYILVHSRLAFCGERKPARAASTRSCLDNPFSGYFGKHCQVLKACDAAVAAGCAAPIATSRTATCQCIDEARKELKQRISGIADTIKEAVSGSGRGAASIGSGSKVDTCVANIKSKLVTPVNDWTTVIDSALSTCIKNKPTGQSLGMDSLLNVGCRKVIADTTGTASAQLKTGFDFVNNLIDAMVDRSGRFCGGPFCA
uniref:Saposin B-type domain-containing protein n=1 Tax=Steinernema glaseri TaxID=37863 RepID=A0A1I7ZZ44_9BILA